MGRGHLLVHLVAHFSAVRRRLEPGAIARGLCRSGDGEVVAIREGQGDARREHRGRPAVNQQAPCGEVQRGLHFGGVGYLREEKGPAPSHWDHLEARRPLARKSRVPKQLRRLQRAEEGIVDSVQAEVAHEALGHEERVEVVLEIGEGEPRLLVRVQDDVGPGGSRSHRDVWSTAKAPVDGPAIQDHAELAVLLFHEEDPGASQGFLREGNHACLVQHADKLFVR